MFDPEIVLLAPKTVLLAVYAVAGLEPDELTLEKSYELVESAIVRPEEEALATGIEGSFA